MVSDDRQYLREMTESSLDRELCKILHYYMQVYDEYYDTGSRDSAFLKDLVDSLIGISAVLEVYVEHQGIHPGYALEKLNSSKSYIDSCIRYYELKKEKISPMLNTFATISSLSETNKLQQKIDKSIKYIEKWQSFPNTNGSTHEELRNLKSILKGEE